MDQLPYDLSLLFCSGLLMTAYIAFAYWVTHRGDFYQVRYWKAAISLAVIFCTIFSAIPLLAGMQAVLGRSWESTIALISSIIGHIFGVLLLFIPLTFIMTIAMHYRLKWWSDDILDKIWKDPNKGHKSPIQDL